MDCIQYIVLCACDYNRNHNHKCYSALSTGMRPSGYYNV